MRILRKANLKQGMSLLHKDVLKSFPKDKGLWCHVFSAFPVSYQNSISGKKMQNIIVGELEKDSNTRIIREKIGEKDIEILILFKLVSKRKRDVDNYTKNIIDSLKKCGLFKDDKQVKFCASKIEYLNVKDAKYYQALEKAIIRIDFFSEENKICKEFNQIFSNAKSEFYL